MDANGVVFSAPADSVLDVVRWPRRNSLRPAHHQVAFLASSFGYTSPEIFHRVILIPDGDRRTGIVQAERRG